MLLGQLLGAFGDPGELLTRGEPVGGAHPEAGLVAALQPGDPHHVELVQVGREDRQELGPLQQRRALVLGEGEHPGVELQPGQLAVEVAVGGQLADRAGLRGRRWRRRARRGRWSAAAPARPTRSGRPAPRSRTLRSAVRRRAGPAKRSPAARRRAPRRRAPCRPAPCRPGSASRRSAESWLFTAIDSPRIRRSCRGPNGGHQGEHLVARRQRRPDQSITLPRV